MTDTEKLKSKIKVSGLKLKHIAERLGITYYGLQLKINNVNEFKSSEIADLCDLLNIKSLREKDEIFFAKRVD